MPSEKNKECLILIPAPDQKREGGSGAPLGRVSAEIQVMAERLKNYRGSWERLLGLKGEALEKAIAANRSVLSSPTLPAMERYAGTLVDGIGFATMTDAGKKFLLENVRFVSAVFGLVHPTGPIPDYRLRMERLSAARHWKEMLAKELEGKYVIDLLPQTYRKAVDYAKGIAVEFVVVKDGKEVPAGPGGQTIKGRFVRFLCQNKVSDAKHFVDFSEDGFQWDWLVFLKRIR